MKLTVLLVATIFTTIAKNPSVSAHYSDGVPMANCGGDFTDVDAILYPSDQLETGDEAYLYTEYTAPFEVNDGYIITTLNINGVSYPDFNSSLCSNREFVVSNFLRAPFKYFSYREYEKMLGAECPILAGNNIHNSSFTVPNVEGIIKSKISWFSDAGQLLLCIKVVADVFAPNEEHHH